MSDPRNGLLPGDVLIGFCGGWFGRDSYEDKRVEAVGADWVVARDNGGAIHFASGDGIHQALIEEMEEEEHVR